MLDLYKSKNKVYLYTHELYYTRLYNYTSQWLQVKLGWPGRNAVKISKRFGYSNSENKYEVQLEIATHLWHIIKRINRFVPIIALRIIYKILDRIKYDVI